MAQMKTLRCQVCNGETDVDVSPIEMPFAQRREGRPGEGMTLYASCRCGAELRYWRPGKRAAATSGGATQI